MMPFFLEHPQLGISVFIAFQFDFPNPNKPLPFVIRHFFLICFRQFLLVLVEGCIFLFNIEIFYYGVWSRRDEVKFVAGKSWNLLSVVVRVASVIASLVFSCVQSQFYPYIQECQDVKVGGI